jgi:hypothetical protein
MKYLAAIALTFTVISSPVVADECDDMAAKIAKSEHLIIAKERSPNGEVLSLDSDKDGYAIDLGCNYPIGFTIVSPPDPPQEWYNSAARVGSILTGVAMTTVLEEIQRCVKTAATSPPSEDGISYDKNTVLVKGMIRFHSRCSVQFEQERHGVMLPWGNKHTPKWGINSVEMTITK